MNCSDVRKVVLTAAEKPKDNQLSSHLSLCRECKNFYQKNLLLEEHLQLFFTEVEIPPYLEQKLVANLEGKKRKQWLFRLLPVPIAAVLLLLFLLLNPLAPKKIESRDNLMALSLQSHLKKLPREFSGRGGVDITGWFKDKVTFTVLLPQDIGGLPPLTGGRKCHLGAVKVAYLFFGEEQDRLSLFVLDAKSLAEPLTEEKASLSQIGDYQVRCWQEGELVYVTVTR